MNDPRLKVENLRTYFHSADGPVKAVDGVNFELEKGEIVGLVGESGSGKTVTAKSVIGLINDPGEIVEGETLFKGDDLTSYSDEQLRKIRGDELAIIFQDISNALNPTKKIWWQIRKILRENTNLEGNLDNTLLQKFRKTEYPRDEVDEAIFQLYDDVGIGSAQQRVDDYPHEFSGGMLQRAMIAMVLGCEPELVIADEPTTNLDVTIEAQILKLLLEVKNQLDTSILFITHDLGVVSELCDRVIVMYAGQIVEKSSVEELFENPKHPYTQGLLKSIPKLDSKTETLEQIDGTVPSPLNFPEGCRFADRCPAVMEECRQQDPELDPAGESEVACHLYNDQEEQVEVDFD